MAELPKFNSIMEFYPYYLTEHSKASTRVFHFIGTSLLFVLIAVSVAKNRLQLLWLLPVIGYGFAWFGHFVFEKNKPATFKYPLYSLGCDFIMFWHMLTFQIKGKMADAFKKFPK